MNSKLFIIISLVLIITACKEEVIPVPEISTTCIPIQNTHPNSEIFQNVIEDYATKGIVGMSVFIHQANQGDWNGAMGYAKLEDQLPMEPCQLGYAASIIKSFIAIIILQLEEEGKLSLEDNLTAYIDQAILAKLPNGESCTIQDLLENRSGMPDVFEVDFLLDFFNHPTRQYTMTELLAYLNGVSPIAVAGEKYYYSDANFVLLSMLIEQMEGDLKTVYQNRIFDRIGLSNSYLIDAPKQIPTTGISASYWDRFGNGQIENVSDYQIALVGGLDGTDGLILSVEDLKQFANGLMNEVLINADSYQKMTTFLAIPEVDRKQNYIAYGLGIGQVKVNDKTWIGSFGNHVGSGAMVLFNPEDGTSISILQNTGTFFNDPIKQTFFYDLIVDLEQAIY